jgi:hypothetical protein
MKKLLNKFVSIFTSFYKWILKLVPVSVEEPKELTKEELTKEELTKEELAKIAFKSIYKVDAETVNTIIGKLNDTHPLHPENKDDRTRLNGFLVEGAKYINEHKNGSPLFYDPEIIDIHNESLEDRVGPTMRQIMMEDDKKVSEILTYQKRVLDNGVQVYPDSIASKMNYKPYKRKEKVVEDNKEVVVNFNNFDELPEKLKAILRPQTSTILE